MLLAINANNTNTCSRVWDGDELQGLWRTATDGKRTADEYVGLARSSCWRWKVCARERHRRRGRSPASCPRPTSTCVTLVPAILPAPIRCGRRAGRACSAPDAMVDRPEEVGADRLVNTVAAQDRYQRPLIVVDFGTATTFDVVDGDGNYCGGVIAPGINLSLQRVATWRRRSCRSIAIRPHRTRHRHGARSSCMQSGVYLGLCRAGRGSGRSASGPSAARRWRSIATGGLAPLFAGATEVIEPCRSRPDPVGAAPDLPAKQQQMNGIRLLPRALVRQTTTRRALFFVPLGGAGEIGMNLNLYGYRGRVADSRLRRHLRR